MLEETLEEVSNKDRLNTWFDTQFLPTYSNPDKIENARKLLHRYQPDDKVLRDIIEWVLEDNKRRALAIKQNKFYRPACNAFSFFNDSRWRDPFPKHDVPLPQASANQNCACGAKMIWTNGDYKFCQKCYDNHFHADFKRKVYDHLCSTGLGKLKDETKEQWIARLKTHAKQTQSRIGTIESRNLAMAPNPPPPSR